MEQALGRPLRKDESVHHRDGNRSRNDIDNLELWVSLAKRGQPYGQRVADLIAFVVEHYPEQLAVLLKEQRSG